MKLNNINFFVALAALIVTGFCVSTSEIPKDNGTSAVVNVSSSEVIEKWRQFERQVKKLSSSIFKTALPLMVSSSTTINLSPGCSRGLMKTLSGIKQMKIWAFQMIDASGKVPNGMLGTNLNSLGEYDMCLDIDVPNHFQGQYCSVKIIFPLPERRPFTSNEMELPEFINFTDPSLLTAFFLHHAQAFYFLNFRTSLCVPSTCSVEDIQKITDTLMEKTETGFEAEVLRCEHKKDVVLTKSDIVIIFVLSILIALAISATFIEVLLKLKGDKQYHSKMQSIVLQCLLCFSLYNNTKRLLKKDDSKESIKIFHGMKVITVLWVMLNHTYYYVNFQTISDLKIVTTWRQRIPFQLMGNGFINVETFFFITAVLVSYGVKKMPGQRLNVTLYIVRRLWRLTPPFMLVIATSYLVPYLGSGPMWHETVVEGVIDKCKKNWWTNLLYFNNFIPVRETCFPWMWYLPADTHLYILALVFLIPLKKNTKLAFAMNGVLFLGGIGATIANNIYYQLHPTAITAFTHPDDADYFVQYGYFRSYLHITTYCTGMTVGYILATKKELRIPLVGNIIGWLLSFIAALTVLYGVYEWNQGNVPSLAVSTLYTSTNKFVWSLALGWVTIACATGNGGIATSILSWQAFVPLSRLTYMAYLVHPVIQFVYGGSTRVLLRADHRTFVFTYFGFVVTGFMTAFVCSLLFESPFMALEKVLLSPKGKKEKEPNGDSKDINENAKRTWKSINLMNKSGVYSLTAKPEEA